MRYLGVDFLRMEYLFFRMKYLSKRFPLFLILIVCSNILSFAQELKVLTIGNSFSQSLSRYFNDVVNSVDGCKLDLEFANFGGCELDRHWKYITEEEQQNKQIYRKGKTTLKKILQSKKWDIITIQQASHKSYIKESYFPYAQNIVDYVKKHCPTAKIYIQQTWSYRADSPRLKQWKLSQYAMFEKLKDAYANASAKLDVKQIYMGEAVQLARKAITEPFVVPTDLKSYKYPDMPRQAGDVVGKYYWKKSKKGYMYLASDTIHLNQYGEYLQACVWFATLYKKSATNIKFIPEIMDNTTAKRFQKIADKVGFLQ